MGENFVGEDFLHLAKIYSPFPDKKSYLCFRSLLLEFKINMFNLIIISYNHNKIFPLQQLSCCLVTGTESIVVM